MREMEWTVDNITPGKGIEIHLTAVEWYRGCWDGCFVGRGALLEAEAGNGALRRPSNHCQPCRACRAASRSIAA